MLPEITLKNCRYIKLPVIQDSIDGCISVAEGNRNIPFDIKRVYYIYKLADRYAIRGKHAHKKLEQVILCIHGSFTMILDDGKNKQTIRLSQQSIGIYIGKFLWHTMTLFSDDCVLMVLASDYYKETDYIRNYSEFKSSIQK